MVALQASNGPGAVRSVLAPSSKARSPDRSFLFPVYLLRCFGWLASCLAGPELRWPSTYKNLERSFARARAPRARANTFHKVSMITKRESTKGTPRGTGNQTQKRQIDFDHCDGHMFTVHATWHWEPTSQASDGRGECGAHRCPGGSMLR